MALLTISTYELVRNPARLRRGALEGAIVTWPDMQANMRSVFGRLVPKGMEAAFFALYAITDKGSAVVGPQVTAVVYNTSLKYDGTFWYCLLAFIISIILMWAMSFTLGQEVDSANMCGPPNMTS